MKPQLQLWGHSKVLTTPTVPVEVPGGLPKARNIINQLCIALSHLNGVGLAANQMGFKERIFVWKMPKENFDHIINPEITELSEEMWEYNEGCLSIPGKFWNISRPRYCTIEGYDNTGLRKVVYGEDLMGRMLQHEIDHMEGKLCVSKIAPDAKKIEEVDFEDHSE